MPKANQPRFTVVVSQETYSWLVAQAEQRAVSITELVRRILDETRGAYVIPPSLTRPPRQP